METLFNVVWLTVGIAGLWRFLRTKPADARVWIGLVALFCAVLLLFPAISISDDLHQEAFIAEDSTSLKKISVSQSTSPVLGLAFLLLSVAALFSEVRRKRWLASSSEVRHSVSFLFTHSIADRAPPALCVQ